MEVSLVLATLGRTKEVGRLVDSLLAQTDGKFELLVMDQNPDDRLVPYVEKAHLGGIDVIYHRLERPGLSNARNKGIALARHDVVAFPDDDCWYEATVIERVRGSMMAGGLDGVVARWSEQAGSAHNTGYRLDRDAWRHFRGGHASSISLFMRRTLLVSLAGFDERMGIGQWFGAAEETDLVLRALDQDASIEYAPDIAVHHAYPPRYNGALFDECGKARRRSRGTGAIYAKHRLPLAVILRGLLAPVVKSLVLWPQPLRFMMAIASSCGRLEGLVRWRLRER